MNRSDRFSSVSVVIPAFDAEAHLAAAIDSVFAQTYPVDECVVVDDGSTDGTAEVVRRYRSRVRYLHQRNAGVSAARNTGIRSSEGDLIAFLDADDVWLPEKIEKQLNVLERETSGVGLVYCGMYEVNEDLEDPVERPTPPPYAALGNTLLMEPPVVSVAQTGLVPRVVLQEVGSFDERLSTSADTDLVCRIGLRYRLIGVPEPLVLYRTHASQMSQDEEAMLRDMEIVFNKVFSHPQAATIGSERRARANLYFTVGLTSLKKRRLLRGARSLLRSLGSDPRRFARLFSDVVSRVARRWMA